MQFANILLTQLFLNNAPCIGIANHQNCFAVSHWRSVPDLARHSDLNIQMYLGVFYGQLDLLLCTSSSSKLSSIKWNIRMMLFSTSFLFIPGQTSGSPRADGFLRWSRRPHHLWPGRGGLRVEVKLPPGTEAGLARRPGVRQPSIDGLRLKVQPGLGL